MCADTLIFAKLRNIQFSQPHSKEFTTFLSLIYSLYFHLHQRPDNFCKANIRIAPLQYLTEINREPIREVLAKYLAHLFGSKIILEVAAGDGTHVSHFAKAFPSSIEWHPTELNEQVLVVFIFHPSLVLRRLLLKVKPHTCN